MTSSGAARRALVTGGSRGIGAAVAVALARDGHDVIVNFAKNEAAAESVVEQIRALGRHAIACRFDVTDREEARARIAELLEQGPIDVLVNNAGVNADAPFPSIGDDAWDRVIGTSLDGLLQRDAAARDADGAAPVGPDHHSFERLRRDRQPRPGQLLGGKGRAHRRDQGARQELAKRHITVNAVAPGLIETDMIAGAPGRRDPQAHPDAPAGQAGRSGRSRGVSWRATRRATSPGR